jgi:hypothetical protein
MCFDELDRLWVSHTNYVHRMSTGDTFTLEQSSVYRAPYYPSTPAYHAGDDRILVVGTFGVPGYNDIYVYNSDFTVAFYAGHAVALRWGIVDAV